MTRSGKNPFPDGRDSQGTPSDLRASDCESVSLSPIERISTTSPIMPTPPMLPTPRSSPDPRTPLTSAKEKVGGFWLLVALIAGIGVAKAVLADTMDPDAFWHLRVADALLAAHRTAGGSLIGGSHTGNPLGGIGPIVDTLAYGSVKTPWTPYSWLAELFMRGVWQLGGYRLAVAATAACSGGIILLLAMACREMTGSRGAVSAQADEFDAPGVQSASDAQPSSASFTPSGDLTAALLTAAGAYLSLAYISFRPVTFALLLLAAIGWLIARDRRRGKAQTCDDDPIDDPIADPSFIGRSRCTSRVFGSRGCGSCGCGPLDCGSLDCGSRGIWAVPLLTALLANVHLYVVFPPAVMLLRAVAVFWRDRTRRPPAGGFRRAAILAGLTCIGAGCTPMLPGMIRAAVDYNAHDVMVASGLIAEMRPFYAGPVGKVTLALVVGLLGLAIARRRRLTPFDVLLLAGGTLALLRWGRFAPVFAIFCLPVIARACAPRRGRVDHPLTHPLMPQQSESRLSTLFWTPLQSQSMPLSRKQNTHPSQSPERVTPTQVPDDRPRVRPHPLASVKVRYAMAVLVCVMAFAVVRGFPRGSEAFDTWLNRHGPGTPGYPTGAASFVDSSVAPVHGRLICEFTWGGYLEWRLGERYRVLLDGRTQLFTGDFWRDACLSDEPARRALLARQLADAAVLPVGRSTFRSALLADGWHLAYEDDRAQVLIPPPPFQSANTPDSKTRPSRSSVAGAAE